MTLHEMNVRAVKNSVVVSALAVMAAGVLSGCAFDAATDPTSTLDGRIDSLVSAHTAYPKWSDFPAAPTDMPSAEQIRSEVEKLEVADTRLNEEVAAVDWQLDEDPAQFISDVRAKVDSVQVEAPTVETQAEIDAFAIRARERAAPPPPVDRPLR